MQAFLKTIFTVLLISCTAVADKVIILSDPEKSLEARVELIMNAKKTIDMQYFTIEHDYISISGLALLREAAKRGVKVRLIVDSLFNLMTREMMSAFLNNLEPMAKRNIEIREYNQFNIFKPFCYTRRMHDKSLIIDGEYLIVGDRNIASGYFNIPESHGGRALPTFQGIDALIAGTKAISEASRYFEQRWTSKDVKEVRLYDYSSSELDYSYCNYKPLSEADTSCEWRRDANVKIISAELEKLNQHYALITKKNSKVIFEQPIKQLLQSAYETNDIRFIHDDALTRVCSGKNPANNIAKTLYETIVENTQKDLLIITPYLAVTPEMEFLIKKLVEEKDISVRFITNSIKSNNEGAASAGYLKTRHRLMNIKNSQSGRKVQIYEYTHISSPSLVDGNGKVLKKGKAVDTVHAKVVLMDNKKVFIGSYNWDYRSQNLNSEVGAVIGLQGAKSTETTAEINAKVATLLKSVKIVQDDGSSSVENDIYDQLTNDEKKSIEADFSHRKEATQLWNHLLNLPVLGDWLLNQI